MEKDSAAEMLKWKGEVTETVYDGMVKRVNLVPLRAREKVHEG